MEVLISPKLVFVDLEAKNSEEVLDQMSHRLLEFGCVKPSYVQAIKDREKIFATGLPGVDMGVAIPHTDLEHVNEDALCFGILKNEVEFNLMGMSDVAIPVKVVFMLALKTAHNQLTFLSKLMEIFQQEEVLNDLISDPNTGVIALKLNDLLIQKKGEME